MKHLVLAFAFLISANAFAGSYDLNCSSADGTISIYKATVTVTAADGSKMEAEYLADSTSGLFPLQMEDFLKTEGPKAFIEMPSMIDNKGNMLRTISQKNLRDECNNRGQETVTRAQYRVLNEKGIELKAATTLTCVERQISGHCF